MALFRRRRDEPDLEASLEPGDEVADERPADGEPAGSSDARTASTSPDAMRRPLDAGEVGPDADATLTRLDLGALRVPVVPGVEVRVELNEQRQPIAVSLVSPRGGVQLIPFAAPRGKGSGTTSGGKSPNWSGRAVGRPARSPARSDRNWLRPSGR